MSNYEHRNGIWGAYRTVKKSASNLWRYHVLRDDSVYDTKSGGSDDASH